MIKCKGCGFPKHGSSVGIIWLSHDGYCSVCNHLLRSREREIIGMDKFVTTTIVKKGTYDHLDSQGVKLTNRRVLHNKILFKNSSMNTPSAYQKALNKGVTKIEEWLK